MSALHETYARAAQWLWPALANHMWQSALFAALVLLATLLLQRAAPARVRFALWLAAAAKFALPAALFAALGGALDVRALWPSSAIEAAPLLLRIAEPVSVQTVAADMVVSVSDARGHSELFCLLTLAWGSGACALFAVWLTRRRELLRSVRGGEEVWSGREFEALGRARARLGLKAEVLLVVSGEGTEPGVWRTRRPVLLLPARVAAQLDEEELETVLLHELAHVERRDNLWGNFQTALECVFWFNPVVWLVGRRLLAERERACDERVLEAGGGAQAYAAGILKVVRFCSGWRVAGVSGAASGSNLRRRIEMIMRGEGSAPRVRAWHRVLVSGAAVAAVLLSVCAGGFGVGRAAVGARALDAVEGAPPPQEERHGRVTAVEQSGEGQGPAAYELERAPEAPVYFEQAADAPVAITEARMRQITREQLRRAEGSGGDSSGDEDSPAFVTLPTLRLANISGKEVREVGVSFTTGGRMNVVASYRAPMRPGESQTISSDWRRRNVIFPGTLADVRLRVVWVTFTDGTRWGGERVRVSSQPDAPDATDSGPRVVVSGTGAGGAVVAGRGEGVAVAGTGTGTGASVGGGSGTGVGKGVGKGVGLDGQKLSAPSPKYPPVAKAAGAEGVVSVRVTVDEEGNVIAAEAVSGHPLLLSAAVDAAREAKFKPTVVDGKPVKVSGVITYNFVLK